MTAPRALAAAALLVVLTGCFKIDMTLDVNEDESVDGRIILAVTEELAQLTGQTREEIVEQFEADVMRAAPAGVTHEPYWAEGLQGTQLNLDGVRLAELDLQFLSIEHEDDQYVVDGRFDPRAVSGLGELSASEQEAFEGIADSMDVRVAITFPGEVIDHNGELDGRTVTWTRRARKQPRSTLAPRTHHARVRHWPDPALPHCSSSARSLC